MTLLSQPELVKLVNKTECGDYALLGEDVLRSAHRVERYCYSQLSPILCESRYIPMTGHPNCEHIKSKFLSIIGACTQRDELSGRDVNCSGFNLETVSISDPLVFCKMSYISSSDSSGSSVGGRVSFKHNELEECQALCESYNSCQGLAKSFNHPRFCIDGGFQGYCTSRIQRIHDDSYITLCRNVVLPFVFANMGDGYQNLSMSMCQNSDASIEGSLLGHRDFLMSRRQELLDTLASDDGYLSWEQDMEKRFQSLTASVEQLVNLFNVCTRYTYNFFGLPYNYDNVVHLECEKTVKLFEGLLSVANALPSASSDMVSTIENIDPVFHFERKLQESVIHLKHFYSLLTSGAHSTILGSQYYRPLDRRTFMSAQKALSQIRQLVPRRVSSIRDFLRSQVPLLRDVDREHRVHETVNELQLLSSLHESQLQWLMRLSGKRPGRAVLRSVE
uniref:Uncharacterized protein n=2 Tax=Babesia bovis TaxID=5865 RepID=A7ARD3_BABBO|eukprot:XP_001610670.1 hypothetical protein [Babesia bovis T2Bo]